MSRPLECVRAHNPNPVYNLGPSKEVNEQLSGERFFINPPGLLTTNRSVQLPVSICAATNFKIRNGDGRMRKQIGFFLGRFGVAGFSTSFNGPVPGTRWTGL